MNKEQKSFWEYGAAWATTVVIHTYIRSLLKDRGIPLSPDVLHTYRDKKSHYGEVLKDAWRWRRICRNITNKTPKKACFFSSEIYGAELAYKKASEAKDELSSWQDERRADNA